MCKSKNQHWVPQFYLRGFAIPETSGTKELQVWILHKETGDPETVNIKKSRQKSICTRQKIPMGIEIGRLMIDLKI